jgi:hypothetical protein
LTAPILYYHGTRAYLAPGELLVPGYGSNYSDKPLSWIYFTARLEGAIWGAELAQGDGPERVYIVEPTGEFFDDPNLTDKKFPGNPTRSFRSRQPLLVVNEVIGFVGHPTEAVQAMKDNVARLLASGAEIID